MGALAPPDNLSGGVFAFIAEMRYKEAGGSDMALATDTQCNPVRGVGDSGRSLFGSVLSAAAVAAAAYNSVKAVELAVQEWELAKRYWQLSRNWLDYYNGAFAPVENMEIAEALALEDEDPIYDTMRGRARVAAYIQSKTLFDRKRDCISKYHTGRKSVIMLRALAAQADAVAAADGMGYRNERAYLEARDDVRFDKQINTAKRGRNIVAQNISFAAATAGIFGSLYDQTWKGLQGAGRFLGYESARNDTFYPTTFMAAQPVAPVAAPQQATTPASAGEA